MKLSSIPILREVVEVREDVSFEVRGINLSDLMVLLQSHAPVAALLWNKLQEGEGDLMSKDVRAIFSQIAFEFPDLVAAIIALASDDNNEMGRKIARQLPAGVQALALEAIFRLSFESDSTLEKLASLAVRGIQGAMRVMENVQIPLTDGSGDSVAA